jgi:hypothetical protein
MAKRISQLDELVSLDGTEELPVAKGGQNFKIKSALVRTVTKESLGLDNVDNTSDANKPISNATQSALNGKAATGHGHAAADITGLTQALAEKANTVHGHQLEQISGLQTALDAKAAALHGHDASSISGLDTLLATKADVGHGHTKDQISGLVNDLVNLQAQINQKAGIVHAHNLSEINGLITVLGTKADVGHAHAVSAIAGLEQYINEAIVANGGAVASVVYDLNEW